MNKKAQAALEFLTTYGWALLVILVMIGALVYFGLLNPTRALPNSCTADTGVYCGDFRITGTTIEVVLSNKMGEGWKNVTLNDDVYSSSGGTGTCGMSGDYGADAKFNLSCSGAEFTDLVGDKVKVSFSFNYTLSKGTYPKTAEVTLFGPVQ